MKLSKRALAIILVLAMVITVLPLTVFAAAESNYLTFTSQEDGSAVTFNPYTNGNTVECSVDGKPFESYTAEVTITLNEGHSVQFRGTNVTTTMGNQFILDGKIAVSGSVTSLIDGNGGSSEVTLSDYCFYCMFYNCTGLVDASELSLPAKTLTTCCYSAMFAGCTSLKAAPKTLPAETLAECCYGAMFQNCTSLETAPTLPVTDLTGATYCYQSMFIGCESLKSAPALPATTLADSCYENMFFGCTSLTEVPELNATTLASRCYYYMFFNCTGIKVSETDGKDAWSIPSGATTATNWNAWMFYGTSGTFTGDPEVGKTYYIGDKPIQLTVTGTEVYNKTYDGSKNATVNVNKDNISGIVANDDVTVTATGTFADKNAGQNKTVTVTYELSGEDAGKYVAPKSETLTANIDQASITVAGTVDEKTYDGTTDAKAYAHVGTPSGIISGDDVTVEIDTATFSDKNAGNGRDVTITYTLTGEDKDNYSVTASSTTTADIKKKVINVTAADKSSYKGADLVALTYTADDLCAGDTFTGALATSANKSVAGTYDIVQDTLSAGNNYTINFTKGTYTVKNITVSFDTDGASEIDNQNLGLNEKVTKPTDPEKTGYTFAGWYTDSNFTTEWNFKENTVTEDITLYAKWIKLSVETPKSGKAACVNEDDLQEILDKYKNQEANKTVVIKLDVSENIPTSDKSLLEQKIGNKSMQAFDTTLSLVVDGVSTDIGGQNDTLISVTYDFDFTNKTNIQVFRVHNNSVDELTETPNADGECVRYDTVAKAAIIKGLYYSTYAIVYDEVVTEETEEEVAQTSDDTAAATFVALATLSAAGFVTLKKKEN